MSQSQVAERPVFELVMCERDKRGRLTGDKYGIKTTQAGDLERFHDKHIRNNKQRIVPLQK